MPYISAPYCSQKESSLLHRVRSSLIQVPFADTHGRHIDLCPWPSHFDSHGVAHFIDNSRQEYHRLKDEKIKPDIVIYATGYTQTFPFLASDEYKTPDEVDTRSIWQSSDPSVAYIGFVRPSFGAIPPLSELQAQLWVTKLLAPHKIPRPLSPKDEPQYRLKASEQARIQYGVDHESYAYQLALDIGSAPSLTDILKKAWGYSGQEKGGWYKLPLVWALGANFNAKFRLVGPWAWEGAEEVLVGELWDTVERRGGFFGHVTLSGLPMLVFGSISLVLWVVEPVLRLFEAVF